MDSSRGEKREVNPPTVYRPEAVYSATIHNPAVGCIYSSKSTEKPNPLGLLTYRSNIRLKADGRTESELSLKVKFLINKIAPSRYVCLYGDAWAV